MVTQPEDFDVQVVRNCPAGAKYYFLFRFGRRNAQARYPAKGTLQICQPFEHPLDCSPGTWLVAYCRDHRGLNTVQHTSHRPHVEVELWVPPSVIEGAEESSQAANRHPHGASDRQDHGARGGHRRSVRSYTNGV